MSRFGEVPAYARRGEQVDASLYNLWRRVRLNLGLPLRFDLPGYRGVSMILEEGHWVCVNAWQQDLPILAWHDFQRRRPALHEPVACVLDYYHFAASRYRQPALNAMEMVLNARLKGKRL